MPGMTDTPNPSGRPAPASNLQRPPHLWKPGQSGNPGGRKPGSRNKLGEQFIADLYDDWKEHGVTAIQAVRKDKPDAYLKVIASILPKDVNVNISQFDAMSEDELIARIRQLDAIVRPFLDSPGVCGGDGGAAAQAVN
jgi:hypothetical protein